jgi:cellulose biosynthesis protein BcsQ
MEPRTAALVGVAGGAGATRLAVETAAMLARDGDSVGVLDAAFATQGLSQHVAGRIDADATSLLTDGDTDPEEARHDLAGTPDDRAPDVPGERGVDREFARDVRSAVYPAFAPFEGLAAAKTPTAAERLGDRLDALAATHDYVLVDTPPVASNQAVAAATSADRVAAVLPPGDRGVDSLQRARGRLADVGIDRSHSSARQTASGGGFDLTVANQTSDPPADADLAVPEHAETGVPDQAVAFTGDGAFTASVAALAECLLDTTVGLDFEDESLVDAARRRLP